MQGFKGLRALAFAAGAIAAGPVGAQSEKPLRTEQLTSMWQFRVYPGGCKLLTIPRFKTGWLRVHDEVRPPRKYVFAVRRSPNVTCGKREDGEVLLDMGDYEVINSRVIRMKFGRQTCLLEINAEMTTSYFLDGADPKILDEGGADHCYENWD